MYVDDVAHEVKAGDFVAVYEGERHWFRNDTQATFAFLELFAPAKYQTVWDDPNLK
jgi:quercetin dioxygenase-like cupin family protein